MRENRQTVYIKHTVDVDNYRGRRGKDSTSVRMPKKVTRYHSINYLPKKKIHVIKCLYIKNIYKLNDNFTSWLKMFTPKA